MEQARIFGKYFINMIVIMAVLAFSMIVLFGCKGKAGKETKEALEAKVQSSSIKIDGRIKYDLVKRWLVADNGVGMLVLISPELFNEKDMTALGLKLKNDTKDYKDAFIFVYDDREAIKLRDKYTDMKTTPAEDEIYQQHMLAQFNKYGTTNYNEFKIFLWGFKNTKVKTVTYL